MKKRISIKQFILFGMIILSLIMAVPIMKDFSQKAFLYFNTILHQFILFKRKLLLFHNKFENIVQKNSFNPNPS